MYRIRKSIDIDFAHHVRGHDGACINIHGHTWKFEVGLEAQSLNEQGFVIDFSLLKRSVLKPCHELLDHGLAIGSSTYDETAKELEALGQLLVASRPDGAPTPQIPREYAGAYNRYPGGIKVAVFPFAPTSETLAHWLWSFANEQLADERVRVSYGRVYEALRPVEAVAEYAP